MRKHLELNRKDKDGKFRLILVESRIHRLARYYRVRATLCHVKQLVKQLMRVSLSSLVSCVFLSSECSSACCAMCSPQERRGCYVLIQEDALVCSMLCG